MLACISKAYMSFIEFELRHAGNIDEAYFCLKCTAYWSFIPAFSLHFILIFTEKLKQLKKKPLVCFLIYAPALVISVLGMNKDLLLKGIVNEYWGWTYNISDNLPTVLVSIWVVSLGILSVYFCLQYFLKIPDNRKKQQARYVLIGLLFPVTVGFVTQGFHHLFRLRIPELTSLSFVLEIAFIGFAIWKYKLFTQNEPDRKLSENELINSRERLKIFFDYAPDAYYINDLKGRFIDGNKAAESLTEYKKEELIGKSFLKLDLLPPNQIPKAVKTLAKNIRGLPTGPDEFNLNRKDGKQASVEIRTYPVKIKGKSLVLGITRDISDRKKTEGKLRKSLKEKDILLKEVHHRVKNNLQIISSLFNLQTEFDKDSRTWSIFKDYKNRIRTIAFIHEDLYRAYA